MFERQSTCKSKSCFRYYIYIIFVCNVVVMCDACKTSKRPRSVSHDHILVDLVLFYFQMILMPYHLFLRVKEIFRKQLIVLQLSSMMVELIATVAMELKLLYKPVHLQLRLQH